MADKLRQLMSITIGFTDGERPTAAKFNALVAQTKRSIEILEYAIGDVRSQSHPYFSNNGVQNGSYLTLPYGRKLTANEPVVGANASGRPLDITSLARLIGPASNLNPTCITPEIDRVVVEPIPVNSHEYSLNHPYSGTVKVYNSGVEMTEGTVGQLGEGTWGKRNSTIYFRGLSPANCTVEYTTKPAMHGGSGNYNGASFNVIPDPAQLDAASGVLVTNQNGPGSPNGVYNITLPKVTHQQKNRNSDNTELDQSDLNYDTDLTLPAWCSELGLGGNFPKGSVYLKCHDTGEVFTDAEYSYDGPTTLTVRNIDLGDGGCGQTYCLLTVGTDITSSIDDIRRKLQEHSHDRSLGGVGVPIHSITKVLNYFAGLGGRIHNTTDVHNYFPQYMHRSGFIFNQNTIDPSEDWGLANFAETRGHFIVGNQEYLDSNFVPRNNVGQRGFSLLKTDAQNAEDPYKNAYLGPFGESFHLSFGALPKVWNSTSGVQSALGSTNRGLDKFAPQMYKSRHGELRLEGMENPTLQTEFAETTLGDSIVYGPVERSMLANYLVSLSSEYFANGCGSQAVPHFEDPVGINYSTMLTNNSLQANHNWDLEGVTEAQAEAWDAYRESVLGQQRYLGLVHSEALYTQFANEGNIADNPSKKVAFTDDNGARISDSLPLSIGGILRHNHLIPDSPRLATVEANPPSSTNWDIGDDGTQFYQLLSHTKNRIVNPSGLGLYSANNINICAFAEETQNKTDLEGNTYQEEDNYGHVNIESSKKVFMGSKQFSADFSEGALFKSSRFHQVVTGAKSDQAVYSVGSGRLAITTQSSSVANQEVSARNYWNGTEWTFPTKEVSTSEQLSDYISSGRKLKLTSKRDMLLHASDGKIVFSTKPHSSHKNPASGSLDTLQKYGEYEQTHRTNLWYDQTGVQQPQSTYTTPSDADILAWIGADIKIDAHLHPEFSNRMQTNAWKSSGLNTNALAYYTQCHRYLKYPDKWNSSAANASQIDEFNTSAFTFHTTDLSTSENYDKPQDKETFAGVGIYNPDESGPPGNKYYFNPALHPYIQQYVSPKDQNAEGRNPNWEMTNLGAQDLINNPQLDPWQLGHYNFYRDHLIANSEVNFLGLVNHKYNSFCKTVFTPVSSELWVKGKVDNRTKRVAIFEDTELGAGSIWYSQANGDLSYRESNRRSMVTFQTRKSYLELGACKYLWQTFLDKDGMPMGQIRSAPYAGSWTDPVEGIEGIDTVYAPIDTDPIQFTSQFTLIAGYYHDGAGDNSGLINRAGKESAFFDENLDDLERDTPANGWFVMPTKSAKAKEDQPNPSSLNFGNYAGVFSPFRLRFSGWNENAGDDQVIDFNQGWSGVGTQSAKLFAAINKQYLTESSQGGNPVLYHYDSYGPTYTSTTTDSNVNHGLRDGNLIEEAGSVQYITRGADYGELMEIGDMEEWGPAPFVTWNKDIHAGDGVTPFGIPSGTIVYVREQKVWMTGPGTPMAVTTRSAVVGNNINTKNPWVVLSFIGQLPVYIHGPAKEGDLLIPDEVTPMSVVAIDKDTCTFEQYKKAIGTCWEAAEQKVERELHQVMCAIGVK